MSTDNPTHAPTAEEPAKSLDDANSEHFELARRLSRFSDKELQTILLLSKTFRALRNEGAELEPQGSPTGPSR